MLVEVRAPDEAALYGQALDWHDPDAGIVTVLVPPLVERLSGLLGLLVLGIGGTPLDRPPSGEAQSVENALARLRAHGVRACLILHAGWLPAVVRAELAPTLALAGIDTFAVTHVADGEVGLFEDSRAGLWGWAELRSAVARFAAASSESRAGTGQRETIPALGLRDPTPVVVRPAHEGAAADVFRELRRALPPAARVATVATALRHVLRQQPLSDGRTAIEGAAAALWEVGYELLAGEPVEGMAATWRDLRSIAETAVAAAIVLAAHGIDDRASAALTSGDVASDGATVRASGRAVPIALAARPYLRVQRFVRPSPDEPFLFLAGSPLTLGQVRSAVIDGLRSIGLMLDPRAMGRSLSPSQRWLAGRGLLVRAAPDLDGRSLAPDPGARPRRCRHALPNSIEVGDTSVSHSQLLCRSRLLDEIRPPDAGYEWRLIGRVRGAERYRIECDGDDRGSVWRVSTPHGVVWLQSMATQRPSTVDARNAVLTEQRAAAQEAVANRARRRGEPAGRRATDSEPE